MKTEKCKMAFLFTTLFLIVNVLSFAQEEDIKNVRLKVVKNNETTLDTSFVMDTDKEALHKKIHELTGIEMKLFTGFDLKHGKHGYKYMAFFDEDKECEDTVKIKKHKKIVKQGEESEVKIIKIIVEKDEDGTIIEKKINIMKVKEEGDEIEVIIEIKEGKEKKKEKEKKLKKS